MDRHTSSDCDSIANISGLRESSHNHGDDISYSMLPYSSTIPTLGEDDDYFQNTFGIYSSFQTQPIIHDEENAVAGKSEGLEKKQNEHKPRQKRCGKMHTISERRRRERIRGKIQALQELIPNCNKWDKASILDDAINYIKSLKLQAEMMSMARGGLFQVPYMSSPTGIQSPQLSPVMHMMRPGMCFSTGQASQMPPLQMQSPFSVPAGLPLMPGTGTRNLGLSHLQMPFYHQQIPASTPTMLPSFHSLRSLSPAIFNYSIQGESSSQYIPPSTSIDCLHFPVTSQLPLEDQVSENVLASSSPSKFQTSYQ